MVLLESVQRPEKNTKTWLQKQIGILPQLNATLNAALNTACHHILKKVKA